MICYHHNDADGRCAGAIVNKYYQENYTTVEKRFIEVDYNMYKDPSIWPRPGESVYIVDYHFSQKVIKKMLEITKLIFVIDHHKSATEVIEQYPKDVNNYSDPSNEFSGCELVWNLLFTDKEMPEAVKLIGDRDAWKWRCANTAQFNEGLKLYIHSPENYIWDILFSTKQEQEKMLTGKGQTLFEQIVEDGYTCLKYRDELTKEFRNQYGYEVEFEGYKCYVMNLILSGIGSEMFGQELKKYDICIGMVFNGQMWKFSLRSNGKVDVSKLCKKYGKKYNTTGGGHAMAAGFLAPEIPFNIRKDM